jgi:pSer/pThr/pTyr-binding forkhead associated (FHA) protein
MLPAISVVMGAMFGKVVRIEGELFVGRGVDCGLRLVEDGVSRRHARFAVAGEKVVGEDAGLGPSVCPRTLHSGRF